MAKNPLNEALRRSIDMYWDEGRPLPDIQRRLYEEGYNPLQIQSTLFNLGEAIARFDSDVPAGRIKQQLMLE